MSDVTFIKKKIMSIQKTLTIKEHELSQSEVLMKEKHGTADIAILLGIAEAIEDKLKLTEVEREQLMITAQEIIEKVQQVE